MSDIYFTSDTHFGHKNILKYEAESRPFSCIEEMNETLIDNWNATVTPKDTVYHLGDFCFGKDNIQIAGRLNGRKILILGNHDTYPIENYTPYFDRIFGGLYWKNCVLTHIPVHPDNLGVRACLNVHGHLHSKQVMDKLGIPCEWAPDPYYLNVGVELHGLKPLHSHVIMQRARELKDD